MCSRDGLWLVPAVTIPYYDVANTNKESCALSAISVELFCSI